MSFEEDFRAVVLQSSDVTDICGQRVVWNEVPDGMLRPMVAIHVVAFSPTYIMNGQTELKSRRLQLDSWALDLPSALALRAAVVAKVNVYVGTSGKTAIQSVFIINAMQGKDPSRGTVAQRYFRASLEVVVWYTTVSNAEAEAIVAAFQSVVGDNGGNVSDGRHALLVQVVSGLIAGRNVWAKLAKVVLTAAEDEQSARTCLKTHEYLGKLGTPEFIVDRGMQSRIENPAPSLFSSFDVSTDTIFTLNSSHMAAYVTADRFDTLDVGAMAFNYWPEASLKVLSLIGGDRVRALGNLSTYGDIAELPVFNAKGYTVVSRQDALTQGLSKNGEPLVITTHPAISLPLAQLRLGSYNNDQGSPDLYGAFHIGAGLDDDDIAQLSAVLNGVYLTTIGANAY